MHPHIIMDKTFTDNCEIHQRFVLDFTAMLYIIILEWLCTRQYLDTSCRGVGRILVKGGLAIATEFQML